MSFTRKKDSAKLQVAIVGHILFFVGFFASWALNWRWFNALLLALGFGVTWLLFAGLASEFFQREADKTMTGLVKIALTGLVLMFITITTLFFVVALFFPDGTTKALCLPRLGCD